MWAARERLGVGADARVSLIWGHAHMLGDGVGGMIGKAKRQLADKVLGYQRISAYDLTDAALVAAGRQVIRHRPDLLIGYSNALDRFAETNANHKHSINRLPLKLVIATGEGFASPAAEARVRSFFRAPMRMEYGSMETGVMAYQFSDEGYQTLWHRHRLERTADEAGVGRKIGNAKPVVVTSLYPRALPVWRYEIGDRIELFAEDESPRLRFANVRGRSNLLVRLPSGEEFHSEAISHVVREVQAIRAFQFVVSGSKNSTILRYLGPRPLTPEEADTLCRRLSRVSATLSSVTFQHSAELGKSPAGKHAIVVYGDLVKEDRV
ncbi:hypothetical protein [Candidatus Phaeomarinobacter ectocarpi]|nr:hypothetical protein [Candidatus Phaeomarinobacter ectocarpi]